MSDRLCFGRFEVLPDERKLLDAGRPLALGARAFDLLLALVERRDRLVGKAELLDVVWPGIVVEEANLQVQVSGLRKLIGTEAIATIPGRGYRFVVPVNGGEAAAARPQGHSAEPMSRSNVPTALGMLIGRDEDVAELSRWVAERRLVTLLGAGGIGKTRLAQAMAHARAGLHPDGVWWVDLSALTSADQIAPAIAAAAGLSLGHGEAVELLARGLAARELLLVLDNCEHLAAGVAAVVRAVLGGASGVRVLATSQEALRLEGEHLYLLSTLAVPPANASLSAARSFAAIQVLEHRARMVNPGFALTDASIEQAIDLCRQLDGVALAIEMAAARLPLLGVANLHARLADRLSALRAARRDVPRRQQTLRATLDWTFALLSPEQRVALRRLSVCAGAFTLDIAEPVTGLTDEAGKQPWLCIDAVAGLVDHSLVQIAGHAPPTYRLPATVRLYAQEALQQAGETDASLQRHGDVMSRLASSAVAEYWTLADTAWLAHHGGYRADWQLAFDRACQRGDAGVAGPVAEALLDLDALLGEEGAACGRAVAAFKLLPSASAPQAARLWNSIANWETAPAVGLDRMDAARQRLGAWALQGDSLQQRVALSWLGIYACAANDLAAAEAALAHMAEVSGHDSSPRLRVFTARIQADILRLRSDWDGCRRGLHRALSLAHDAGLTLAAAVLATLLADTALLMGDAEASITLGEQLVAKLRALPLQSQLGRALGNLCGAYLIAGNVPRALAAAAEAWPLMWREGLHGYLFDHLAAIDAAHGAFDRAACLLGLAHTWYAGSGRRREANECRVADLARRAIDAAIGADAREALTKEGRSLAEPQARALAQATLAAARPPGARSRSPA